MRRKSLCALAVLTCLALSGCDRGMIHVSALEPALEPVTTRHDAYVKTDEKLSPVEREIYLRSTELLRKLIEEAKATSNP